MTRQHAVSLWAAATALVLVGVVGARHDASRAAVGDAEQRARAAFPFAPPLDVPMRLEVRRAQRAHDGKLYHFSATYAVRFSAAGRGYRLVSRLTDLQSDAPARLSGAFGGMLAPLKGVDVEFLVSPDGANLDLIDGDALWAQLHLADTARRTDSGQAEARVLVNTLAALSPAQREAVLSVDMVRMLSFAGRVAEAGDVADAGRGAPVGGIDMAPRGVRRIQVAGPLVEIVEDAATSTAGDAPRFETRSIWHVAASSGLVMAEERVTHLFGTTPAAGPLHARVTRTLTIDAPTATTPG